MTDNKVLLDWFRSVGIELHPALYLKQDSITGLSFFTSQALPPDTKAVSVPISACITAQIAKDAITSTVSTDPPFLPPSDWILLYLFITRLLVDCSSSLSDQQINSHPLCKHLVYVEWIPSFIPTPLHFRSAELELLKATPLYGATQDQFKATLTNFENAIGWLYEALSSKDLSHDSVLDLVKSQLDRLDYQNRPNVNHDAFLTSNHYPPLELWRWCQSAYASRAFPPRLLGMTQQSDSSSYNDAPVLIPGLDTFNHGRAKPVTWSHSSHHHHVEMTLHYPLDPNTQVLNNYGGKSNEEFLGSYGFVLPESQETTLALQLGSNSSSSSSSLQTTTCKAKTYYWLQNSSTPPDGLLEEIRTKINQSNYNSVSSKQKDSLSIDILETLEILLLQKRKSFKSFDRQISQQISFDEESSSSSSSSLPPWSVTVRNSFPSIRKNVWDMVQVYRQGQRSLLNQAIQWTRDQLEQIADQLDQENEANN